MDQWAGRQCDGNDGEQKTERMTRNENLERELWDNIKHINMYIIGPPEGEERDSN